MTESWTIRHFSLSNPVDTDRSDVPLLLRRLADQLEECGPIEVQDIVMHTEVEAEGYVHSFTVYFSRGEADDEPQGLRLVEPARDSSEDTEPAGLE